MFLRAINSHVKLVQSNRSSREISLKTDGNFDLPSLVKEQMLLHCFFFLLLHRIIPKFSFQYAFYWQAHLIHLPSVWGKVCIKLEIYASDTDMLQFHSKNKYSLVWLVLFIFFFFLDSYRKLKNVPNGLNLESFALSCWPLWVLSAAHHKLPSFTVLASKFCFYLRSAFRVWNEYSPVLNICIMWLWLMQNISVSVIFVRSIWRTEKV